MTGDLIHARNGRDAVERGLDQLGNGRRQDGIRPGVTAPDLCRVTVLSETIQVDLALPTDVPIALLVPGLVDMLNPRGSTGAPRAGTGRAWNLSKVGHPPLDDAATLNEATIRDGDLLVLGNAESPAPAPLFDDLMFAVADSGSSAGSLWTPRTAQIVGFVVAALAVAVACVASVRAAESGDRTTTIVAAATAVVFVLAGSVAGRVYRDDRTGVFLSTAALPIAFVAGSGFVPGHLGAAHVLLGSAATAATAVLAMRLGDHGRATFTGACAIGIVAAVAATIVLFTDVPVASVGTGAAVVALAGLAIAPRISMMQAKLPLPPVPTAGAPLVDDSEDDHLSVEDLEDMSARARSYLKGLVYAACAVATTGALVAAGADGLDRPTSPGVALAVLVALVLLLRGRTFAESQHAVPLVASGAVIVLALLTAFVLALGNRALAGFAVAALVAVTAVVFGSLIPRREYSPVLRRAAEIAEYIVIAAVVPVACWVVGLYSAMRGL